jgi:NAD(P)H-hydrate epimerase
MKPLTSAQMKRIDRMVTKRLKIPGFLLMDNAGRCVAEAARQLLKSRDGRKVSVLCGGGNNGGDGMAAARYMKGWGYGINVFWLKNPTKADADVVRHYQLAKRCGVPFFPFHRISARKRVKTLREANVLIDAILGTGTRGHLRVPVFDAIASMNAARRPIVSVDLPSGLDPDTGRVGDIAVRARVTVTMAASKKGFLLRSARHYIGKVHIADIGIPHHLLSNG